MSHPFLTTVAAHGSVEEYKVSCQSSADSQQLEQCYERELAAVDCGLLTVGSGLFRLYKGEEA